MKRITHTTVFKALLDVLCVIGGTVNLGIYAWGAHDPANLAVGSFCFFVALWKPKWSDYE